MDNFKYIGRGPLCSVPLKKLICPTYGHIGSLLIICFKVSFCGTLGSTIKICECGDHPIAPKTQRQTLLLSPCDHSLHLQSFPPFLTFFDWTDTNSFPLPYSILRLSERHNATHPPCREQVVSRAKAQAIPLHSQR
jgi:hypothetical protein